MFGKLLKNDLKAQWHSMSTLYTAIIVIVTALELLVCFTKNKVLSALGGCGVTVVMFFSCVAVLLAVASLFGKTMFGRAGYLTMSLPVKTGSLVASKTVSGLIWIFTVFALFIGSFLLWAVQLTDVIGEEMQSSVEELLSVFGVPSITTVTIGVTIILISLASTVLVAVQSIFLGETLSHVSPVSKLGKFGALIIFFGVFFAITSLSVKLSDFIDFGIVITDDVVSFTTEFAATRAKLGDSSMTIKFTSAIVNIICAVALHFPITKLVKDKVNLG